jgi:hypothetical protein
MHTLSLMPIFICCAVSKPREQAVDSELFALVTESGLAFVNKLARGGKAYTPADFVRRLKARFVDDGDAQVRGAEDPYAFNWCVLSSFLPVGLFSTSFLSHLFFY